MSTVTVSVRGDNVDFEEETTDLHISEMRTLYRDGERIVPGEITTTLQWTTPCSGRLPATRT